MSIPVSSLKEQMIEKTCCTHYWWFTTSFP